MSKPTQDLIEEHGCIMLMLNIMDKIAQRLRKGEDVNKQHLDKMIEFLQNFVDKCHHGKEEDILFPELIKNPSHLKAINELLGEHQAGRDYIRGIAESIPHYKTGNSDAFHIAENIDGYIRLLTHHIQDENTHLFPQANIELSETLQAKIEAQFSALERDVIGAGKHEEYHGLLHDLSEIYLN